MRLSRHAGRIFQYLLLLAAGGAVAAFVVAGLGEAESGAITTAPAGSQASAVAVSTTSVAPLVPAPVGEGTGAGSNGERLLPPAAAATSDADTTTTIQMVPQVGDSATSTTEAATPPSTSQPTSASTTAVTTTAPPAPAVTAPAPPASRFVAGDVAALFATGGGDDPVGTAREILRRSGPLATQFADDPIVIDKLTAALNGALLVGASDFANRILPAINAATDAIASEQADAGTGLCLIVGPGYSCVQVAALNHTFSALPHR
ncbi:MAG: hypothetical protein GXP35_13835, partial [Actinobacteria bacterium]|nr:hypothetical protein [Actinomycetota bacterium]